MYRNVCVRVGVYSYPGKQTNKQTNLQTYKLTNKHKLHNAQVCHLFNTAWDDEHMFIEHLSTDHLKFVIPIWNPHLETNI